MIAGIFTPPARTQPLPPTKRCHPHGFLSHEQNFREITPPSIPEGNRIIAADEAPSVATLLADKGGVKEFFIVVDANEATTDPLSATSEK